MKQNHKLKGFTLIELMVVLVIMGVLAALIVPNIIGRTDEARRTAAKTDIATIMQSLKLYKLDNGMYPTQQQGLRALVEKPDVPPIPSNWRTYLEKLPTDPWGNPYQYLNPGVKGSVDVFSYGSKGATAIQGGNNSSVIGSWQNN
jgi:general secretion pathway protein G